MPFPLEISNFNNNDINSIFINTSVVNPPRYTRYSPLVSQDSNNWKNRWRSETYSGKPKGEHRDLPNGRNGNQGKPKGGNLDNRQCANGNLGKPQGEHPDIHENDSSRASLGDVYRGKPKGKHHDMQIQKDPHVGKPKGARQDEKLLDGSYHSRQVSGEQTSSISTASWKCDPIDLTIKKNTNKEAIDLTAETITKNTNKDTIGAAY